MTQQPKLQPLCRTCLRAAKGCINITDTCVPCLHYSPVPGASQPTVCDLECHRRSDSMNGCNEWVRVESCTEWQKAKGRKEKLTGLVAMAEEFMRGGNVAAGGVIREVEEVVGKSLSDRCRELVEPHIAYTVGMLKVHGVAQELIDATAHTYRQAWVHAWKHCLEECSVAQVEGK